MPQDEDYYDDYEDELYHLIALDEFNHQKTMQQLNRWLDGQVQSIKKKGKQYLKKQNLPFIIVSNYSPEQVFPKLAQANLLAPFITRLKIIEVKQIDIENIAWEEEEETEYEGEEKHIGWDTNGSPLFEPMDESEEDV